MMTITLRQGIPGQPYIPVWDYGYPSSMSRERGNGRRRFGMIDMDKVFFLPFLPLENVCQPKRKVNSHLKWRAV